VGSNKRIFEYLVKWFRWEVYDSTWEPAKNIPDLPYYEDYYLTAARDEGVLARYKVGLLAEASEWFDENTGKRLVEKLREAGVEKRMWWDDDP